MPTAITARLPTRLTFSFSSSVSASPRRVQKPKAMKASAATRLIHPVGRAAPRPNPMPTDTRCTTAVAMVMPRSTGQTLKRVAKVSAMSWDLSPSSATKMTPKATSVLTRTASTGRWASLVRPGRRRETSTRQRAAWIEGLARLAGAGPRGRTSAGRTGVRQHVDRDIGGYSPSLTLRLPAVAPAGAPARERDGRLTRARPAGRAAPGRRREGDRRHPDQHQEHAEEQGEPHRPAGQRERDQVEPDDDGPADRPRSTAVVP